MGTELYDNPVSTATGPLAHMSTKAAGARTMNDEFFRGIEKILGKRDR
ncbi:hypothetical protein ABZ815_04345 [Nonomuraea sp. NPDC047529]